MDTRRRRVISFTIADAKHYLASQPPHPPEAPATLEELAGMMNDARWMEGDEAVAAYEEVAEKAIEALRQALKAEDIT